MNIKLAESGDKELKLRQSSQDKEPKSVREIKFKCFFLQLLLLSSVSNFPVVHRILLSFCGLDFEAMLVHSYHILPAWKPIVEVTQTESKFSGGGKKAFRLGLK